jgi:hypothetical protein
VSDRFDLTVGGASHPFEVADIVAALAAGGMRVEAIRELGGAGTVRLTGDVESERHRVSEMPREGATLDVNGRSYLVRRVEEVTVVTLVLADGSDR